MTRWLLIALTLSACAKSKDSAPAPTTAAPTAEDKPAEPSPAATPTPTTGNRAEVVDMARNQGGLGVSTQTSSFDPLDEGSGKGTAKPNEDKRQRNDAPRTVAPGSGGGADVKVGSSGATRGSDSQKLTYRAQITAVKLDGKPSPSALVKAIKANLSKVQACYDKTLASWPELVGELAVTFTVLPTGALTAGAVGTSTVKQDVLEACVIGALQATKLASPLSKTDAKAEVTITFKAK